MPVGGKERALGVESQLHIGSVEPLPGALRRWECRDQWINIQLNKAD